VIPMLAAALLGVLPLAALVATLFWMARR